MSKTAERIAVLADQVIGGESVSRPQADWLAAIDDDHLHDLFRGATRIREHFIGKRVRCCSIVSSKTGRCSEDCAFCSQSAHFRTHVQGLTVLDRDQVLDAARQAAANGADSFGLVNSGWGPTDADLDHWAPVLKRIRAAGATRTCASLGILGDGQAERLVESGCQRYNHNLQTSRRHYPNIIRTHSYDERLATLHRAKAAGLSLCSGALFGMGEAWEDRLDLAFELREIGVDVVPLNFLIPIDGTPLEGSAPLPPMECLKIIAIYRYLLPRQEIKIAGGREKNLRDLQSWIFYAGADSFLVGNYLTTYGRPAEEDRRMVRDLGLELVEYESCGTADAEADRPASRSHDQIDDDAQGSSGDVALPVLGHAT